ncbi:MAG TPA: FtsX-like permease family protein [Dongiaceae bacterium]|nr:FtsX-like permease family protein [Dongiaceae bacterium]
MKNALRNKRRALLSVLSVAASLFLLVTLLVALRELTSPPAGLGAALRVAVRNKISITNLLPARQRPIIEHIPGVAAVTPFTWFGGKYQNEEGMTFAQFALDAKVVRRLFVDLKMTEAEWKDFEDEKTAAIVGKITADKYHFHVGQRITLDSTVYPGALTFKIAGIYQGTADDRNMFFHQDYLDDSIGLPGQVGMWWLKVKTIEDMPGVIAKVNQAFANTSAEVRAESERAFQLGFISMWGNIKMLISSICTVVVFTLVLVSASTMSMAVRERFRELAILKAIGFRRRELFALILAESFGLAVAGGLLGIGGAYVLFTYVDVSKMTHGIFVAFEVTPKIMGLAALVAGTLGVIASIAPSIAVARMSVVNGLKTLD